MRAALRIRRPKAFRRREKRRAGSGSQISSSPSPEPVQTRPRSYYPPKKTPRGYRTFRRADARMGAPDFCLFWPVHVLKTMPCVHSQFQICSLHMGPSVLRPRQNHSFLRELSYSPRYFNIRTPKTPRRVHFRPLFGLKSGPKRAGCFFRPFFL